MEPENLALDRYILEQTFEPEPRACFLGTASGDDDGYVLRFYQAFSSLGARPTSLSLFRPHTADLRSFLLEQHVIYVGGGNTRSMLALWREWGIDAILREAWEKEIVLAGLSAGAICWFEEGISDYLPGEMNRVEGLGLLPGSHAPHYDGEAARRPAYRELIASGRIAPGIAADDGVALHYVGTELRAVLSSRSTAWAWSVSRQADRAVEERIEPVRLGADGQERTTVKERQ